MKTLTDRINVLDIITPIRLNNLSTVQGKSFTDDVYVWMRNVLDTAVGVSNIVKVFVDSALHTRRRMGNREFLRFEATPKIQVVYGVIPDKNILYDSHWHQDASEKAFLIAPTSSEVVRHYAQWIWRIWGNQEQNLEDIVDRI